MGEREREPEKEGREEKEELYENAEIEGKNICVRNRYIDR